MNLRYVSLATLLQCRNRRAQLNLDIRKSRVTFENFHQFLEAARLFMQYGYSHVFAIATDIPIAKWL